MTDNTESVLEEFEQAYHRGLAHEQHGVGDVVQFAKVYFKRKLQESCESARKQERGEWEKKYNL